MTHHVITPERRNSEAEAGDDLPEGIKTVAIKAPAQETIKYFANEDVIKTQQDVDNFINVNAEHLQGVTKEIGQCSAIVMESPALPELITILKYCGSLQFRGNRLSLRAGKPCVPEKLIGTLTSSILKSVHTIASPIILYKLHCITTPYCSKCFRFKNYVHTVIFTLDLQRVSFCSVIDFLYHSLTNTLLLPLIPIEGFIRALRPLINMREIVNILMALWRANLCRIATRFGTSDRRFWGAPHSPEYLMP